MEPKGNQMEPKGSQMDPKGSQMDPKGSPMEPKVAPRETTGAPKTPKGSQGGKLYIHKLPIHRPSGPLVITLPVDPLTGVETNGLLFPGFMVYISATWFMAISSIMRILLDTSYKCIHDAAHACGYSWIPFENAYIMLPMHADTCGYLMKMYTSCCPCMRILVDTS